MIYAHLEHNALDVEREWARFDDGLSLGARSGCRCYVLLPDKGGRVHGGTKDRRSRAKTARRLLTLHHAWSTWHRKAVATRILQLEIDAGDAGSITRDSIQAPGFIQVHRDAVAGLETDAEEAGSGRY